MAATNSTPLKPFTQLMDASVIAYKKYFKSIAALAAIDFLAWLPLQLLPRDESPFLTFIATLIYLVVSVVVGIAILYLVDDHQPDKSLGALLRLGLGRFIPVVLTSILAVLAVFGGFLLLIIPGIIFAIWFAFIQQVVVFEDKRYAQALKQSRQYVRGRWWGVFGRLLLLTLVLLVATILAAIITSPGYLANPIVPIFLNNLLSALVITPFAAIFSYQLYRSAVETYSAE